MRSNYEDLLAWLETKLTWAKTFTLGYGTQNANTITPAVYLVPNQGTWPDQWKMEGKALLFVQVMKTTKPQEVLLDYAEEIRGHFITTPNPSGWALVKPEGWEIDQDETGSQGILAMDLALIM